MENVKNVEGRNVVISRVTNDLFIAGKSYFCSEVYVRYNPDLYEDILSETTNDYIACVDVICETGDAAAISVNSKDFEIHLMNNEEFVDETQPYIRGRYNPKYGDNRLCKCGHSYARHFDSWDNMDPIGCKYCGCTRFTQAKED